MTFRSLLILMDPLGQAAMQRPQPLHRSVLILMKPFFKGQSPVNFAEGRNDRVDLPALSRQFLEKGMLATAPKSTVKSSKDD